MLMSGNKRAVGWPVSRDLCMRVARKQKINTKEDRWLSALVHSIQAAGCKVTFEMVDPHVAKEDEKDFILAIYRGGRDISEERVEEIASQLPSEFDKIKKHFGIEGSPRHLVVLP